MKIFVVSMAMILIGVSAMCFVSDMNTFMLAQKKLKTKAEDCANYAVLQVDEEALSNGEVKVDPVKAEEAVRYMLTINGLDEISENVTVSGAAVKVELTYEGKDFFRLPFLCVNKIQRSAIYAWE